MEDAAASQYEAQEKALIASIQDLVSKLSLAQARRALGVDDHAAGSSGSGSEAGTGQPTRLEASSSLSAPAAASPTGMKGRLVVVANRLPISVSQDAAGKYNFKMSSGGLVSALVSVRDKLQFIWIGWLGKEIPEKDQPMIRERLLKEYSCLPVFISDDLADLYYSGFANSELWPRFHYEHSVTGGEKFDFSLWEAYKQANAQFADVILEAAGPDDMVWLHDYHLMVLPAMLRKRMPNNTIAWFLHTPWPSSEIYRMLPVRAEILRGLLACDLLGFHTYDYARHFVASCSRVLRGVEVSPTSIAYRGQRASVGVYPIGIEPDHFLKIVRTDACQRRIKELARQFEGMRVIVAVDRLDPIKGIPHRLLGLEALFRRYPAWIGRVVFLQVAVPSRTDVATYQKLTAQVNQLVGSINGQFGTLSYQPVHYMYRSVDPTELCALYSIGDVALITSLRDGMNLVCEEYIACHKEPCEQRGAPGALVLSEFAGCAQSLAGAIRVNPWSPDDVADGVHTALTLTPQERQLRWEKLYAYVSTYTSQQWASAFVAAMVQEERARSEARLQARAEELVPAALAERMSGARKRMLVFHLEDTLLRMYPPEEVAAAVAVSSAISGSSGGDASGGVSQQSTPVPLPPATAAAGGATTSASPAAANAATLAAVAAARVASTTSPEEDVDAGAAGAAPEDGDESSATHRATLAMDAAVRAWLNDLSDAAFGTFKLPPKLKAMLERMVQSPANIVVIVSRFSKASLTAVFKDMPGLRIIAENGMLVRLPPLDNTASTTSVGSAAGGNPLLALLSSAASAVKSNRHSMRLVTTPNRPSLHGAFATHAAAAAAAAVAAAASLPSSGSHIPSDTHASGGGASPAASGSTPGAGVDGAKPQQIVGGGIQVSRAGSDSSVLSAAGARSSPFPMSGFVADRWFAVGSGVVGAPLREHVVLPAEAAQRTATGASDNGASATRSGALSSAAGGGSDDASSVGATGLAQSDDMLSAASIAASAWKTPVRAILEYFVARTPGSFIAETDNVLSWNFRNSDADLAAWQSKELQLHLETTLTSAPLDVVSSEHAVNVCIRAGSIETALLHIVDHELLRDGGMPPIGFYFSAAASKGARRVSDALLAVRATLASLYPTLPGASGRGGPLPASSGEAGAGSSATGMDAPPRGAAPACICVPRGLASSFESCGATFTCPTVAAVAHVLEKL